MNNDNLSRKRKSPTLPTETSQDGAPSTTPPPSSSIAEETSIITCPRCHHTVPSSNRVVHEVNCSRRIGVSTREFSEEPTTTTAAPTTTRSSSSELQRDEHSDSMPAVAPVEDASRHNIEIARELANVMIDDANSERAAGLRPIESRPINSWSSHNVPSNNVGDVDASSTVAEAAASISTTAASTGSNSSEANSAEWACPRCTLLNPTSFTHCDACLLPRRGNTAMEMSNNDATISRPPDPTTTTRLIGDPFVSDILHGNDEGWVNISRNNNNGDWIPTDNTNTNRGQPNERLTTGYRIFNSALNGAMIGSIFGGIGGMIFGGLAGGLGGAYVSSRLQNPQDVDVQNALITNDNDNNNRGTVRVHRGRNHLIAISSNGNGTQRILRLRYNNNNNNATPIGTAEENRQMEQALSELLLRMSYMHGIGGRYGNVVIQPNMSYEQLLERFGMGDENRRGASAEIIDSYPVVVIGEEDVASKKMGVQDETCGLESTEGTAANAEEKDYGTCGICLEDYRNGDHKKCLSCPHSFHKECIDRWLKQVASCPICKKEVEMYVPQEVDAKKPAAAG